MKNILPVVLILISKFAIAQMPSCCSPQDGFAMLSNDPSFVMQHEDPLPFVYKSDTGSMITYVCADGKTANAFYVPAKHKTDNYLFVVHEWWGLNDYIKQIAEKLYHDLGDKVNIIAIDLYDGLVASDKKTASDYMDKLDNNRAMAIINGAINYAGKDARIATIGWCMGGGYSLQASIAAQKQGVGCVMYYGMPETDTKKIETLNADVLMMWANQDKWINKQVVDDFKLKMEAAGKNLTVREYNADHAFANPSNPHFDEVSTKDAYDAALVFLKLKFGV